MAERFYPLNWKTGSIPSRTRQSYRDFHDFLRNSGKYGLGSLRMTPTEDTPPKVPGPTSGLLDSYLQPTNQPDRNGIKIGRAGAEISISLSVRSGPGPKFFLLLRYGPGRDHSYSSWSGSGRAWKSGPCRHLVQDPSKDNWICIYNQPTTFKCITKQF